MRRITDSVGTDITTARVPHVTVSPSHDPPESYQFNKLRDAGGSTRLTLVKSAVDTAGIAPRPPRPQVAHIPAGDGVWLAFDVDQYDSQQTRVEARKALTAQLPGDSRIVGEYPVSLRGKLGSAVTIVPKELAETVGIEIGDQISTVAVTSGVLLFLEEERVSELDIVTILDAIRAVLSK
jgi:antitoxin component of MazEF toxin-antitoxin module